MNTATVIRDVSISLKDFIRANIEELSREDAVLFDSPADVEKPTRPTLLMYLYHVEPNAYMRNEPPVIEKGEGLKGRMTLPPYIVDLYYMFIPYAQNRETELILFDKLIYLFHHRGDLAVENLQGALKDAGEPVRMVPHRIAMEELGRLWMSFPNKPFKLSQFYILTPVRIPSEEEEFTRAQKFRHDTGTIENGEAKYHDSTTQGGAGQ